MQSSHDQATSANAKPRPATSSILPTRTSAKSSSASNIKGKDLFDSILWKDPISTSVFYAFIASLRKRIRDEVKATTPTHRFIRTLRDSQKLVRCYTQNIDGLEAREGLCTNMERGKGSRLRFTKKSLALPKVPARKLPGPDQDGGCEVVQLHGDLDVLRCTLCQKTCGWEEGGREALLLSGKAPECLSCALQDQDRRDRGKRGTKIGTLRPNIVLYGEEHPAGDAISNITTNDLSFAPDVLLILGTSLHVHGLKVLVKEFAKAVHARAGGKGKVVLVNLSKPPESVWSNVIDYWIAMDCDQWVAAMKRHRPDLWRIQTELQPRTTKSGVPSAKTSPAKRSDSMDHEKENIVPNAAPHEAGESPLRSRTTMMEASLRASRPIKSVDRKRGNSVLGEKSLKRKRPMETQQLPTPPPSGHRQRLHDPAKGKGLELSSTPSKRRKVEIVIHED